MNCHEKAMTSQEEESHGVILQNIELVVTELLRNSSRCDIELAHSTSLGSLGMDSLKLVEIIFALETRFAIVADEQLMAELETVGDLITLIHQACITKEPTTI
ncbi:MAG: acyl carrier protein [Pseudohongiellaceae bacterium]